MLIFSTFSVTPIPRQGRYDLEIRNSSYERDQAEFKCMMKQAGTGGLLHTSKVTSGYIIMYCEARLLRIVKEPRLDPFRDKIFIHKSIIQKRKRICCCAWCTETFFLSPFRLHSRKTMFESNLLGYAENHFKVVLILISPRSPLIYPDSDSCLDV